MGVYNISLIYRLVSYIIPIMNRDKVVIDTNVIVAALRSRNGASHKLLNLLAEDRYTPCVSIPLFIEYESVLKRPGLVDHLSPREIDDVLNYLLAQSSLRKIYYLWRPFLKDPKDDLVLEVAVESESEYIVTFNAKDFSGIDKFDVKVATPLEFLKIIGGLT